MPKQRKRQRQIETQSYCNLFKLQNKESNKWSFFLQTINNPPKRRDSTNPERYQKISTDSIEFCFYCLN